MVVKFHFMCTLKGVSDFSDLTGEICVHMFGKVIALERWSLTRAGHMWRFDYTFLVQTAPNLS